MAAGLVKELGGDLATSLLSALRDSGSHLVRRQAGTGWRIAGEVALWPADPSRIAKTIRHDVSSVMSQLRPSDEAFLRPKINEYLIFHEKSSKRQKSQFSVVT